MRSAVSRPVTPQGKMINVSRRFGNPSIKKQQGTTRTLYDSIPIDGRSEYRFFEESNTRQFPLTNMSNSGNKLGVGDAMVVERCYLSVIEKDPDSGAIVAIYDVDTFGAPGITIGELAFEIANGQKIKEVTGMSFDPRFNKSAAYNGYNNFEFDTQLVIQPLLEFVFKYRVHQQPAVANHYFRFTIEGAAAIISMDQTI